MDSANLRICNSSFKFQAFKLKNILTLQPPQLFLAKNLWVWASPVSLAATKGMLISLYSSGYWDVSLPQVCSYHIVNVDRHYWFTIVGFPIRTSPDHRLLRASPKHFAATLRPSSLFDAKASSIHPYCSFRLLMDESLYVLNKMQTFVSTSLGRNTPSRFPLLARRNKILLLLTLL